MEHQGIQSYTSFLSENSKELTVLLLLGALAGAAYYFFSFSQPVEITSYEEKGVLDLFQITVNDYKNENQKWKLKGKRAVISEKSNRMRIEQVKIWVFAHDNSTENPSQQLSVANNILQVVQLFITADQGLIERHDNRVTLSGNVVLFRDDGTEVHTETAIYNAKKDILNMPKTVSILSKGHTMNGSGLTYNISKGELNLRDPLLSKHDKVSKNTD